MVRDQGWSYLACESSLDARLNISFRRADELERTFFSIRFWCLVDFDHSIPRETWTLLALCLGARSSIWYFIWSCKRKRGEQVKHTVFILLMWRESEKRVWSFIWLERICCWFLSPHSYPLTMLQHRITEYHAIDQLTRVYSNRYYLAMKQLSFIFSYLWGIKDKVCDSPLTMAGIFFNDKLIS